MSYLEIHKGPYFISTNPSLLDQKLIFSFLINESYWAPGLTPEILQTSINNSLVFGVYLQNRAQVGFTRVITDHVTVAYLVDVFIVKDYRKKGLGHWLLETICSHPTLQNLRRFLLATKDAHGLYAKFGFTPLTQPEIFMEKTTILI